MRRVNLNGHDATEHDVTCPCGARMQLRRTELRLWYACSAGCAEVVPAHFNGRPNGVAVPLELATARSRAHRALDQLWRSYRMSRPAVYKWLSARMGLPNERAHIGCFTVEQCNRVVRLVDGALPRGAR